MDSIERLIHRNAFELSGMFGFESGGTVYSRVNRLASSDGMVGYALDAMRQGYFGEEANRLILVEYQALTRAPLDTPRQIYALLGEPWFEHDFENVEYEADDFDLALGTRGLHTIRRRVEWIERRTVLPPDLFDGFRNDMFWRMPGDGSRDVPIVRFDG
jgi:sulfotransferase